MTTFSQIWKKHWLNFFWVFRDCLKRWLQFWWFQTTLGLLKRKTFWNKGYDVIFSAHDVIKKFLSRDSNCIVDVVMRPMFGNSNTSVRKVNLNFIRFWPKKTLFLRSGLGSSHKLGIRYGLEISHQSGKKFNQKVLVNSYVCRSYRGKSGRGTLCPHPHPPHPHPE